MSFGHRRCKAQRPPTQNVRLANPAERTREDMAIAKRNGKLRGKQPKLSDSAQRSIRRRYAAGEVS